jgi:hypothetical protein
MVLVVLFQSKSRRLLAFDFFVFAPMAQKQKTKLKEQSSKLRLGG